MSGSIYVVATPIGNLADISLRALQILKDVDVIAAEDTRHSKRLLNHYDITTPVMSLHEHNERAKVPELINEIADGKNVALISDAGTPLISDPGFRLVREAQNAQLPVVPIPGACALVSALSAAGLASDTFYFAGFLPAKSQARINQLKPLDHRSETLIFYEAPHRVIACLEDLINVFGENRMAAIARELTKTFETIKKDSLQHLLTFVRDDHNQQKGEFVILVEGKKSKDADDMAQALLVYEILAQELPMKQAVKLAAEIAGIKKNALYQAVLGG